MTAFLAFLGNLLSIGSKLPALLAILRAIVDLVGSDQVQKLLESIKDAIQKETPIPDVAPITEPARLRLLDRVRQRLGLDWLGMSDADYDAVCQMKGVSGRIEPETYV